MPRELGGLGIKDLEKFGRALILKWLWYGWDNVEKPWKHILKIADYTERQLFFSSTLVHIGNGKIHPSGRQDGFMENLLKNWRLASSIQLDSNTDLSISN
jgi:hypothetical protein